MNKIKNEYFFLILILLIAFYLNFTPHMDYSYPVHVDEWTNFAYSQSLINSKNTVFIEPFIGEKIIENDLEIGMRLFLALFKEITGLEWLYVVRYLPSVIFLITVLSVYVFASKSGYGLQAAFLAAMIPTSVRLIGPGFLVAVGVGILFIPLSLFIAHYSKKYSILLIYIVFLFLLHPPTALAIILLLIPYIVLNYGKDTPHSKKLAITLLFAFLISLPRLYFLVFPTAEAIISPTNYFLPPAPEVFKVYGYIPTFLFVLGIFYISMNYDSKGYSLVVASILLLLPIVLFARYQIGYGIIYDRNFSYLMILMGIIGGYGLANMYNSIKVRRGGRVLYLLIILLTLGTSITSHASSPYYHVIDNTKYDDFIWIKNNMGDIKGITVLDPWTAKAYVPITGRFVYSHIPLGPSQYTFQRNNEIYQFFKNKGKNSSFLTSNNISIVYTDSLIDNSELVKIKPRIYLYYSFVNSSVPSLDSSTIKIDNVTISTPLIADMR